MNFKNSKASNPHRLLLNLSEKINLKRKDKYVALSHLNIYYTWKIKKVIKKKKKKLKCQLQHQMKNLNYQMDILYQNYV